MVEHVVDAVAYQHLLFMHTSAVIPWIPSNACYFLSNALQPAPVQQHQVRQLALLTVPSFSFFLSVTRR